MADVFMVAGIVLLVSMLLTLYRVVAGPTVLDRILGGNVIGAQTTVLLLLIGLIYGNVGMFVDIALAYALLNFIATLGATKYFLRRKGVHLEVEVEERKEAAE